MTTPTQHRGATALAASPQSLPQFIELDKQLFANIGFHERETIQRVLRLGHIAHVWSGHETREHPTGPVTARGINSFQFVERWAALVRVVGNLGQ